MLPSLAADIEIKLQRLESRYSDGLTTAQIIGVLQSLGCRVTQDNFKRYVKLGLLPRSQRVGIKGGRLGTYGVYPVSIVRAILIIRNLSLAGATLAEIGQRITSLTDPTPALRTTLEGIFTGFEEGIEALSDPDSRKKAVEELALARIEMKNLFEALQQLREVV